MRKIAITIILLVGLACGTSQTGDNPVNSYNDLCKKASESTTAQWGNFFTEIKGEKINWNGFVTDVRDSQVVIGQHQGLQNIWLYDVEPEKLAQLQKGQRITFSGTLQTFDQDSCVSGINDGMISD